MEPWVMWLMIIAAGTALSFCVSLWFRTVSRIMQKQKSVLEIAAGQLAAVRMQAHGNRYDPNLSQRIKGCEIAYKQAELSYTKEFGKPWIWLPAKLLGYRAVPPEDYYTLGKDNWKV